MNKKLLTIATLGACVIATEGLAVKMWVENKSDYEVKVEFGAKTKAWQTKKPFIVPPHTEKSKDLVGGTHLGWYSINGNKYDVNLKGVYWKILVDGFPSPDKRIKVRLIMGAFDLATGVQWFNAPPPLRSNWEKEKIIKI